LDTELADPASQWSSPSNGPFTGRSASAIAGLATNEPASTSMVAAMTPAAWCGFTSTSEVVSIGERSAPFVPAAQASSRSRVAAR
jgi:hypothetical protein